MHELKTIIVEFNKDTNYDGTLSFIMGDIAGFMKALNVEDGTNLVCIYNYSGNESDFEQVRKIVDDYKDNSVICTTACASMTEFPEDQYTLDIEEEPDKKLIPIDEVIAREINRLEAVGFVDFNFYTEYEQMSAMIYPNELGNKIVELAKEYAVE